MRISLIVWPLLSSGLAGLSGVTSTSVTASSIIEAVSDGTTSDSSSGMGTGAIVGIVFGCIGGLLLLACIGFFCYMHIGSVQAGQEWQESKKGKKPKEDCHEIQRPITTASPAASPSKVDEGPQTNPIPSMGKVDEYVTQA